MADKVVQKRYLLTGLLLTSACFHSPLQADPQRSVLISAGQATQADGNVTGQLQTLGYTAVSSRADKQANAWSVGYRHPVNARWSADIQYLQQGKTTPHIQATLPLGKTTAQAAKDAAEALPERGQGVSAVALYHHPVQRSKLNLQAGLGAFVWQSKRTARIGSQSHTAKADGLSPMVQLGVHYPMNRTVSLEAHWQHTFMPDEDVDRLGIGLAVGF